MRKNKIALIIFFCIISLISFGGCKNKRITQEETKEKVIQELNYLDMQIISVLNKLNNITLQMYNITSEEVSKSDNSKGSNSQSKSTGVQEEQKSSNSQDENNNSEEDSNITATQLEPKTVLETDEGDIDWANIKSEIEIINNAWAVILMDLSSFNIESKDILNFSSTLDECILNIKNENKEETIINLAMLYSYIPKYEIAVSAPKSEQNIKQAKSYLVNAYSLVGQDKWEEINNNIGECENNLKLLSNDLEYINNNEYKVNKTYVFVKELQNSLGYRDKKLFYMKYKNLLQSINTL